MVLAIQNEWLKVRHQKKTKVLFLLVVLAVVMINMANIYASNRIGITFVSSSQAPLTVIDIVGSLLLPLVAFVVAIEQTATEIDHGTIKHDLMAPISRTKLFLSKLGTMTLFNGILLGATFGLTYLINVFGMGSSFGSSFITGVGALMITMIPLTLVSLWGLFIGLFFGSGLGIGLGIIGVLALNVGQIFMDVLGSISPLGYMSLYNNVMFGNLLSKTTVSMLLYILAYYIILITLSVVRIENKDF